MPSHDHAYKLLFSHPQMVRDLIVGFVPGSWQALLDLRSLEKSNSHFIAESLRGRTSDIVWRIRSGINEDAYLLLEFQSTVEGLMTVRVMTYVGLLYQDLIRTGRVSRRRLHPILPVVLYCEEKPWRAPTSLRSIPVTSRAVPLEFRPDVRFHLIDVRRQRLDARGLKHNLAAALFRIENSRNLRAAFENARSLYANLKQSGMASLRRAFYAWIYRVVVARFRSSKAAMKMFSLGEKHSMLSERIDRWLAELEAKGRRKGQREGRAVLLLEQLQTRFGGKLPRRVQCHVQNATSAQLKRWGRRVLTATSLPDVFGGRHRPSANHQNTARPLASIQSRKH